jgi:hypothetical protein
VADELLQLEFLLHDLMEFGGPTFFVIGLGVRDFNLMQLLSAARDRRADGSFGVGRLRLLRDEGAHKFSFCADYVEFHL